MNQLDTNNNEAPKQGPHILSAFGETWKQLSTLCGCANDISRVQLHKTANIEILNENEFMATITNGYFLVNTIISDKHFIETLHKEGEYYRHEDGTYSLTIDKRINCKAKDKFEVSSIAFLYDNNISFNRGEFPKWKNLVPNFGDDAPEIKLGQIAIGSRPMGDLLTCFKVLGIESFAMSFTGELGAIKIESGKFNGVALLMPCKLDKVL